MEQAQREGFSAGDDPHLVAVAMVSMLNQFCYTQLSGDRVTAPVDDEACITTLANVFYEPSTTRRSTVTRNAQASGTPGVNREFVGMDSPTARRAGSGGHPCQGIYHRGMGRKPKVAMIATHYQIDFAEHYLADYMATRGIGFLAGTPASAATRAVFSWITHWST